MDIVAEENLRVIDDLGHRPECIGCLDCTCESIDGELHPRIIERLRLKRKRFIQDICVLVAIIVAVISVITISVLLSIYIN